MSKRKKPMQETREAMPPEICLPSPTAVERPVGPEVQREPEPTERPEQPEQARETLLKPKERTVKIDVPISEAPITGYRSRRFHVEVQLGHKEAVAFRGIQAALDARHARLAGGRVVQSKADVVRWLFERIAGA